MSKGSSSGGFYGWGTVGLIALLVVGGFLARNQFTNVNGNNNNTNVQGGIQNNNTINK